MAKSICQPHVDWAKKLSRIAWSQMVHPVIQENYFTASRSTCSITGSVDSK